MILRKVRYTNFRNIEEQTVEFSPGVNLLYGENAEGKTNALEGIYLCARGRSHRTAHEKEYLRYKEEFARVILTYEDAVREQTLEICYRKNGRKYCKKNGLSLGKMSEFIGNFRAVIFCPEYLSIVREGPSERRGFMDAAVSQLDRTYVTALQNYMTALQQRNKLIAQGAFDPAPFRMTGALWAEKLAEYGEIISFKRAEYMEKIDKEVASLFLDMTSGAETPQLLYRKPMKKEEYLRLYEENEERELRAGMTLFGVHKDDIEILLNDRPARSFASQGQQRSIAVCMKLAEGEICRKATGEYPVFLLDDVLSELDENRKSFILSGLRDRQVLITCCDRNDAKMVPEGRLIRVEKGQYTIVR